MKKRLYYSLFENERELLIFVHNRKIEDIITISIKGKYWYIWYFLNEETVKRSEVCKHKFTHFHHKDSVCSKCGYVDEGSANLSEAQLT